MPSVSAPSQTAKQEAVSLDMNMSLRSILSRAVGSVLGRQLSESFHAVTYEELADQQIERIEGQGTSTRPNELERLASLESDLLNAVAQIRNIPPENFILADRSVDVNTPVDPDS